MAPVCSTKRDMGRSSLGGLGRWPAKNSYGDPVEKRTVVTPDRRYDPELVPPEWSQWLKMTRREPPTEEEIAGYLLSSYCMSKPAPLVRNTIWAGIEGLPL